MFAPLMIVLTQLDPVKDLILAIRIMVLLGGLRVVFSHPDIFSSCVSKKKSNSFFFTFHHTFFNIT